MTHSPDLYALVIRLAARENGRLRTTQGDMAHAAFLNILREADPALAQAVHDMDGRKPFTLSPLHGFGHGRNGQLNIQAGQDGWLRVTLLDADLFQAFIHYFLQGGRPIIRLEARTFLVTEILSAPNSHPLAGTDTLEALFHRWETRPFSPDMQQIRLRFRTPTAFSLRDPAVPHRHSHVLPDPPLVFGELAGYWDRLTGHETQEAVRAYAAVHVVVARHKIETHMLQYRRGKQVGFTGDVTFRILDAEHEPLIRHLNRLADLAFFTGVGSKTTMGQGQLARHGRM
ncbi:MAG: CRISPR system precrRNA processing endoribonuclease RAMP protein Cas6 [Anaerolineales bacterium]|nr:CRISPR system precrRNA processing endoribonuclease RAMP protein Cas6 [Anaerolineales bacterium]